jgi:hypothetical protein
LDVGPDILLPDNHPDSLERANRIFIEGSKGVALAIHWVPQLGVVGFPVDSCHEPALAIWDRLSKNDVRVDIVGTRRVLGIQLLDAHVSINIVKVVAKKNCVLLGITHAEVQELLGSTSEVWHVFEKGLVV